MKGGLGKSKKTLYTTYIDFALGILIEGINIREGSSNWQITGGNETFKDDFTSWIKMRAEPMHDFGETHPTFRLQNEILLRTYDNILKYNRTNLEDQVLLALIQDLRTPHGISAKYIRFYKKVKTLSSSEDEMTDLNQIWNNVESAFDAGMDGTGTNRNKFFIFNSSITGISLKDQFSPASYRRITALPVLWDSVASKHTIDFSIKDNSDAFYDTIYHKVHTELYNITGIQLAIREVNRKIMMTIYIPAISAEKSFVLQNKGFPIPTIRYAVNAVLNGETLDKSKEITPIVEFLQEAGVFTRNIVSFLLVCKMSGDAGQVEFLRRISSYTGDIILYNKKASETVKLNSQNKDLYFLYTGDRLCAANAIVNGVKCVFGYSGYIAQFLGSESTFDVINFLDPYLPIIQKALRLTGSSQYATDVFSMSHDDKFTAIVSLYYNLFSIIFNHTRAAIIIHQSQKPRTGTVDSFVRYVIALGGLVAIHEDYEKILNTIIRKYFSSRTQEWSLLTLEKMFETDAFDPLLTFFTNILIIPDEEDELRRQVYTFLSEKLLKTGKIIITTSHRSFSLAYLA